ncbi:2-keto-4-pentenoate hydratase [Polymorphobacter fuscus]|uniref:2-keto-4-pentenoate hydratase n=1 Tax=Sandarakinorhabdus fusca TaxID=1439888 RepID=A0A7C9KK22_9SPHN|nr:2-keto-4-pentenoate hydratase [Polymorphobacter fuscus]MQT18720.1 2-keto-4-pentenoate hydratase [Polymorphobacter fuscus]
MAGADNDAGRDSNADPARIAGVFVAARRSATPIGDYPGTIPETLADGYAIQDQAIALRGGAIAGWKVGRILPPLDAHYRSQRLAGPIFADRVVMADDGASRAMTVFAGGFGAVEAEFVFRLGIVDPAKTHYSLAEAAAAVAGVHVGIEIASSPLGAINDLGPAVTVSDFGNNQGLIVGPEIADWASAGFDSWPVSVAIDGVEIGSGMAGNFPDGTVGSVKFLLELLAQRGIAVPVGTWVSSGAVSGVHVIASGQSATARFGDRFRLDCHIERAAPDAG